MELLGGVVAVILVLLVILLAVLYMVSRLFVKVPQGQALVISTMNSVLVTFTGRVVLPVVHKAEVMDISVKTIDLNRTGKDGLICKDNIRADVSISFYLRVSQSEDDVIKVAQSIGCERASDQATLQQLFVAKFAEALKTVGKGLDFEDLYTNRDGFRDGIIRMIGTDLNGYVLEDVAIDYLEQTPLESLDPQNILDAQGIRKITQLTAEQNVQTNEFRNEESKRIKAKDVETREAILELERQEADAAARQQREIATIQSRERAAAEKVSAEQDLIAETARLQTKEQVGIQEQNLQREIETAEQNRLRAIAVEEEKVAKARALERVAAEAETTAAQMSLEQEKARVANIVRDRVAVEKTVAEEEEAIETLRAVEGADRERQAAVIRAEGEAQAQLVAEIKAAEAAEAASTHEAKRQLTLAKASLEAADLEAKGDIRRAEGMQATAAADGLAAAEVKEAEAVATEKMGLAEVRVKEADAIAVEKIGAAEGHAMEARLKGEAAGLTEKAAAMAKLEGVGQAHEEFVRRLEADKEVALADVEARVGIARANAEAIAASLSNADIDIVGGTDMFVDRLMAAATGGKQVDAFLANSEAAAGATRRYTNGEASILGDLAGALGNGAESIQQLTVAAFLNRMMAGAGESGRGRISRVLDVLREQGLDELTFDELRD